MMLRPLRSIINISSYPLTRWWWWVGGSEKFLCAFYGNFCALFPSEMETPGERGLGRLISAVKRVRGGRSKVKSFSNRQ